MDNGFPDWCTVDENTPPMYKHVLGYVVDRRYSERTGIYIVGLLDGGWWVRYSEGSLPISEGQIVTHWRYLPNAPDK